MNVSAEKTEFSPCVLFSVSSALLAAAATAVFDEKAASMVSAAPLSDDDFSTLLRACAFLHATLDYTSTLGNDQDNAQHELGDQPACTSRASRLPAMEAKIASRHDLCLAMTTINPFDDADSEVENPEEWQVQGGLECPSVGPEAGPAVHGGLSSPALTTWL